MADIQTEAQRRRTFAIISHPDAGKTTLTEKLLLFGGAIQLAGQVRAKGDRRRTRSDWMAIERARGISVVTSVMTFEYNNTVSNKLNTVLLYSKVITEVTTEMPRARSIAIQSERVRRLSPLARTWPAS